jgi:hypothetical protein
MFLARLQKDLAFYFWLFKLGKKAQLLVFLKGQLSPKKLFLASHCCG